MDPDETLLFCLEQGFPAPLIQAMLDLAEAGYRNRDSCLADVQEAWQAWMGGLSSGFCDAVEQVTGDAVQPCGSCSDLTWSDDVTEVDGWRSVCESCLDGYYFCGWCEEWYSETTTVGDNEYCSSCLSNHCSYCDHCDEWYCDDDDDHNHSGCECEAPHQRFRFPADGAGTVAQDERITVELPKGTIDDEGIARIQGLLYNETGYWEVVGETLESVGQTWQTKRGNFTRRLSSAFHKRGVKLSPEILSEIGNLARAHSSEGSDWHIEFTRDLNLPAEEFANDESCYWSTTESYSQSRCCLKSWGALGMRCYEPDSSRHYPDGRVWIQPLNSDLQPTHDAINAHAYVVFNGYERLASHVAARIVAHLTGKTYRKVTYSPDCQYVNGDSGYLIADEETCSSTERVHIRLGVHDSADAYTFQTKASAA